MSLDEFYERRKTQCITEALDYARSIQARYHRRPKVTDFREEFALFVDGDKMNQYPEIKDIMHFQLGPSYESYKKHHKAEYADFEAFLKAAGIQ